MTAVGSSSSRLTTSARCPFRRRLRTIAVPQQTTFRAVIGLTVFALTVFGGVALPRVLHFQRNFDHHE